MNISTKTGCTFDEADDSVLVVCSETGKDLGNIYELSANSAGILSGSIQTNAGAFKHIRERHSEQINNWSKALSHFYVRYADRFPKAA